ncbi:MAG: hypothetical protein RLZZ396_1750 [Planctomycetota bacterium]
MPALLPLGTLSPPGLWLGEKGRGDRGGKTARKAVFPTADEHEYSLVQKTQPLMHTDER